MGSEVDHYLSIRKCSEKRGMKGSAPWAHDNQVYEEAGVAWNGEGCGGNESPAIVFPFPFPFPFP